LAIAGRRCFEGLKVAVAVVCLVELSPYPSRTLALDVFHRPPMLDLGQSLLERLPQRYQSAIAASGSGRKRKVNNSSHIQAWSVNPAEHAGVVWSVMW
jgi:hypothetical protein